MDTQPPGIRSRLLALLVGPWYLLVITAVFTNATRSPPLQTFVAVFAGSVAIMVVLGVFGVKADRHTGRRLRFNLSSIMLFIVPLSIYLAAIRHVLRALPTRELYVLSWLKVAGVSLIFMILSTAILLWFAEALMWFVLSLLRLFSSSRHDRH
ncbi:MAG: hypothetical protein H8E44_16065 [Planctomycetes bacterium]|nr:hypothetical protein [Planctomycetota bacterium]